MKKLTGIVFLLSILFACTKSVNENILSKSSEWQEKTLTIDLNKCGNINFGPDQLTLCLDSVSDFRCPINANCIWGGTAIARFTFTKNGQQYPVVLAIPPFASYQQEIKVANYTLKLINVSPYPEYNTNTPPADIDAKVEIKNY
jgi:hypothetical protein